MKNLYLKRGTYWFAQQRGGKRTWHNLHTGDLSTAITLAADLKNSPLHAPVENIRAEIARFVAYKLRMNQYSKQSAATKPIPLLQFADTLPGAFTSKSVNKEHVQRFYNALQTQPRGERRDGAEKDPKRTLPVTESTAHGYMMALRSFFEWCVEVERTRLDNPVAKVALARNDAKGRLAFCTKAHKNALIKNAPTDDLRFVLFCGFDAGLRRGEIDQVRVDWFSNGMLHVRKTATFRPKDRDERSIPLTKPFARFIRGYLKGKQPHWFALQPDVEQGVWRYRYDIRRPFTDYMIAQNCPWVTPHVMRHSFASILASSGISIFKISEWMGDRVEVVQKHYAKLNPGDEDIHALS